jgi:Domain of unknown function (DUF6985)
MKATGTSSAIPKLKWDNGEWTAEVVLPAWKGFLSRRGPYNSSSSARRSTGKVLLCVLTANDERIEPTAHQQLAWADMATNQEATRDAILRAVLKEFARFCRANVEVLDEIVPALPRRVSNPDELRKLIGLAKVFVHADSKGGVAYVGYGFGCEWDEEHGLGVLTHRKRVIAVGHEDVAFVADADVASLRPQRKPTRRKTRPLKPENLNLEVIEGNVTRVKKLLAAGASPNKRYNPVHYNAIETAAIQGHAAVLMLLLEHAKKPVKLRPIALFIKDKPAITRILDEYGVKQMS